jgi:hypothetical protein
MVAVDFLTSMHSFAEGWTLAGFQSHIRVLHPKDVILILTNIHSIPSNIIFILYKDILHIPAGTSESFAIVKTCTNISFNPASLLSSMHFFCKGMDLTRSQCHIRVLRSKYVMLILPNILLIPSKINFILYKDILFISLTST